MKATFWSTCHVMNSKNLVSSCSWFHWMDPSGCSQWISSQRYSTWSAIILNRYWQVEEKGRKFSVPFSLVDWLKLWCRKRKNHITLDQVRPRLHGSVHWTLTPEWMIAPYCSSRNEKRKIIVSLKMIFLLLLFSYQYFIFQNSSYSLQHAHQPKTHKQ